MNDPNEVQQKNIQAGWVAGRDIHNHQYLTPAHAEFDGLVKSFHEDLKGDQQPKAMLDDLMHLSTQRQNDKVIGLEAKLSAAGRDGDYIARGEEMKERFSKRLYKHTFSESAQKIYLCLLNDVAMLFQLRVLPRILEGAPPAEVDALISKEIIAVVEARLGPHKFVLDLYAREIAGMLYFLTGNCHLNWIRAC